MRFHHLLFVSYCTRLFCILEEYVVLETDITRHPHRRRQLPDICISKLVLEIGWTMILFLFKFLIWVSLFISLFCCRLWACSSWDWCWQSVLHVLCNPWYPTHTGYVPEPWGAHEHSCSDVAKKNKAVPGNEADNSLHEKYGCGWFSLMYGDIRHWGSCLFLFWRLDFLSCLLLLLHNIDHHWIWRLCCPAETWSFAEEAPLCSIQLYVYPSGLDSDWGLS